MNGTQIQLERRRLNEEIESSFIIAAKAASNIEMKLFSGKGSITGDLQDFYNNFNYLNRLTCNLKEMETKDETEKLAILKLKVRNWLRNGIAKINDEKQVNIIARSGIDLFDDYYGALVHCGLVSLPTKR
jgi:hypothetical protein